MQDNEAPAMRPRDDYGSTAPATQRPQKALRLWPGVVGASVIALSLLVAPFVISDGTLVMLGGAVGALLVLVWWLAFSRARWLERVSALVAIVVAAVAMRPFLDPSVAGAGMGRMFYIFAVPAMCLGLVAWAMATRGMRGGVRRLTTMIGAIVIACASLTLVRTGGITGDARQDWHWRWTPTPEERLLASTRDEPAPVPGSADVPAPEKQPTAPPVSSESRTPRTAATPSAAPATSAKDAPTPWPGFRGPGRDSIIPGVRIDTDWSANPPKELWRRSIGPAWSSFSVSGGLIYTQEQRGENEVVSAYRLATGAPVWRHSQHARFYESNGGPGPRGTPTVHNGRVYSVGATGIVSALDARTGAVVWSRNAANDTGAKIPGWGFASSPIVVDDLVIVAASGRLAGYDIGSGNPRWVRTTIGGGYSSPQLAMIDGVPQVLLLSGGGVTSVAPADGSVLWQHPWQEGVSIVQPALVAERDVIITAGDMMGGTGMRRISVTHNASGWATEERWTTRNLKPYFNDFVVHNGYAFGFDGRILACIDLQNGERKWKGGRYGAGQLVLLSDQNLLLVLSEEGELALVNAVPDGFSEVARFQALEGKTWNHPVLVGDVLLVRNDREMAAFRLASTTLPPR
jgi:outer membrane protein assembly factor BamB